MFNVTESEYYSKISMKINVRKNNILKNIRNLIIKFY